MDQHHIDTGDYPPYLRIARLNSQLAAQCRRLDQTSVPGQAPTPLDDVENLLLATMHSDWPQVARLCQRLARWPPNQTNQAVVRQARKLCEELREDPRQQTTHPHATTAGAPRQLGALLDVCRSLKLRHRSHLPAP
jgi:hypothetical protein